MRSIITFMSLFYPFVLSANKLIFNPSDKFENLFDFMVDIIHLNLKSNGWDNILCVGHLPDNFYTKIQPIIPFSFVITNIDRDDHDFDEDVVPYHSNIIVINCDTFEELELILRKSKTMPHWHPNSNIFLHYEEKDNLKLAKIFFLLWYHRISNAIIIQYDTEESIMISYFNQYISENFKLDHNFGCWSSKVLGKNVINFEKELICVNDCQNVTLHSKLRANNLGTCIGLNTVTVFHGDCESVKKYNLFEDKGKNLHGFVLRTYAAEVLPFLTIDKVEDGTGEGRWAIGARDGIIWNTMAELLNFSIDLTPSLNVMKKPFHFEIVINQLFSFTLRKGDLFLIPIYQFELIIIEIDFTSPYKGSGACMLSHRADFETILFDVKRLQDSVELIIRFLICFFCIWLIFCIFSWAENGRITQDQIGKALLNTVRNVLLINLHRPPKKPSFRIFLGISLWSFFVFNFVTQASIVSFFTAVKRGKEIETFEDIIEKGYPIEGMASPDIILPNTEERYRKISALVTPALDLFACVNLMTNDSRRFCLLDCAVARYLERNKLDEKGEQYLHVVKDRIHSHYLSMILPQYSPMTDQFSKYIMSLFEAGLVIKWEEYRYNDMKTDATIKPLGMEDFIGIYKAYFCSIGFIVTIFVLELSLGIMSTLDITGKSILEKLKKRNTKTKVKCERKPINKRCLCSMT